MDIEKSVTVTLVIIVILAVLLVPLILMGSADDTEDLANSGRFMVVEKFGYNTKIFSGRPVYIFVDKHTGVMYLQVNGNSGACGMTVMLDADGKPLLWEGVK